VSKGVRRKEETVLDWEIRVKVRGSWRDLSWILKLWFLENKNNIQLFIII
jgi:hypothetical protein